MNSRTRNMTFGAAAALALLAAVVATSDERANDRAVAGGTPSPPPSDEPATAHPVSRPVAILAEPRAVAAAPFAESPEEVAPPPAEPVPAAVSGRQVRVTVVDDAGVPQANRELVFRFEQPIPAPEPSAVRALVPTLDRRRTGADGRAVCEAPADAERRFECSLADQYLYDAHAFTRWIAVGAKGALVAEQSRIVIETEDDATMVLRRLPALTGKVVDHAGLPVEYAWCELFLRVAGRDEPVAAGTCTTGFSGAICLPIPRDGVALPLDAAIHEATVRVFSPQDTQPTVFALGGAFEHDTDVGALEVRRPVWASFFVTDASGRKLEQVRIAVPGEGGCRDPRRPMLEPSGGDGTVRWCVRPGEDLVLIGASGHVDRIVTVAGAEEAKGRPPKEVRLDAAAKVVVRCLTDAGDAVGVESALAYVRLVADVSPVWIGGDAERIDRAATSAPSYATKWIQTSPAVGDQAPGAEFHGVRPGVALRVETRRENWKGGRTVVTALASGEERNVDVVVPGLRRLAIRVVDADGTGVANALISCSLADGGLRVLDGETNAEGRLDALVPFGAATLSTRAADGKAFVHVAVASHEDRATLRLGP